MHERVGVKLLTFRMLLGVFLAGVIFGASGCDRTTEVSTGTVNLSVQFNGQAFDLSLQLPCSSGATVFDVMESGRKAGKIKFESHGSGEMVFISSIGGVDNQKSAGDNWTYKVNGELAKKGCGAYEVSAGDKILWSFGKYSPDLKEKSSDSDTTD